MIKHRWGGFWRRGGALLIDKFILYLMYVALIIVEFSIFPASIYTSHLDQPSGIWGDLTSWFVLGHCLIFLIISMAYFTYFHGAIGQTPGKMVFRLHVVGITGTKLSYGVAFVRWIGYILSSMVCFVGFLWAAFDSKKQGWHDKLAGTVVEFVNDEDRTTKNTLTSKGLFYR